MKRCKASPGQLDELTAALLDQELLEYINTHPNATPEEIIEHFGIPFRKELWNDTLVKHPNLLERMQQSPNPLDRKNWRIRRDD